MEFKLMEFGSLNYGPKIRRESDERLFAELKASIIAKGIIYPLLVKSDGKKYLVIDGARRLQACHELGWGKSEKLPVLLIKAGDSKAVETALIANTVRGNFSAANLAEAVNLLVNKYDKSVAEIAASLGKSEVYIRRLLAVYKLPAKIITALRRGEITIAHGHWLTRLLDDPKTLEGVYTKVIAEDLSYRDLEILVSGLLSRNSGQKERYAYFSPKVINTKAGSRLRFEPRRNSIRLELNLQLEDIDSALAEVRRELDKLSKRHLKSVVTV